MKKIAALLCIILFASSIVPALADGITPNNFQAKFDACCAAYGNTEIGKTEQKNGEHGEFLSACACLITAYHGTKNMSDAYAALLHHYFMCKTGKSDSNEPYVMSDYTAFIMRKDSKGTYTFSIQK